MITSLPADRILSLSGAARAGEAGADPQDEEIIDKKGRGW